MRIIRTFILTLPLLLASSSASAQEYLEVKPFELEVKAGATYPIDKQVGSRRPGLGLGIEARWNLRELPLDLGFEIGLSTAVSTLDGSDNSNRIYSWTAVADYNFMRGHKASPFVGLGLGCADCDVPEGWYSRQGTRLMVMPRAGVELFRHLRLTVDARIAMKGYNTVGLTVGYAFGGGLKHSR